MITIARLCFIYTGSFRPLNSPMRVHTVISPTLKMRGLGHREIIVINKSYKAVKIGARLESRKSGSRVCALNFPATLPLSEACSYDVPGRSTPKWHASDSRVVLEVSAQSGAPFDAVVEDVSKCISGLWLPLVDTLPQNHSGS